MTAKQAKERAKSLVLHEQASDNHISTTRPEVSSDDDVQESAPFKIVGRKEHWDLSQTNELLGYLADNFESYTKDVKATFHQKAATSVGQGHTPAQVKNKLDRLSNNMRK